MTADERNSLLIVALLIALAALAVGPLTRVMGIANHFILKFW